MRIDGRQPDELRDITIIPNYSRYPEGSALIMCGNTHVLCNVTVEEGVPRWLQEKGESSGWITAEYAMLPRATQIRSIRETSGLKGRTQEIKRLISRSLRQAVDLNLLGSRTCIVDCDVLQADGGTRTMAITGGYVALTIAIRKLIRDGIIPAEAMTGNVAAVSVGLVSEDILLDLCYQEDSMAVLDANVVKKYPDQFIEIQISAEKSTFSSSDAAKMLEFAENGIRTLFEIQDRVLGQVT